MHPLFIRLSDILKHSFYSLILLQTILFKAAFSLDYSVTDAYKSDDFTVAVVPISKSIDLWNAPGTHYNFVLQQQTQQASFLEKLLAYSDSFGGGF